VGGDSYWLVGASGFKLSWAQSRLVWQVYYSVRMSVSILVFIFFFVSV